MGAPSDIVLVMQPRARTTTTALYCLAGLAMVACGGLWIASKGPQASGQPGSEATDSAGVPDFSISGLPRGWRTEPALDGGVRYQGAWASRTKVLIPPYEPSSEAQTLY